MQDLPLIAWCLAHLNYWVIACLMAIESSFIPFPSEVVVPPAAYLAASGQGGLNVVLVVVFATLGALVGAFVNYALAYYLGRPLVMRFAQSRLGHLCLLDARKVEQAERYFDRHGAVATLIGRLVPAVRQLISIPAGLARMGLARFAFYTALGAGLWNSILATIGYSLAGVVPYDQLDAAVAHYEAYIKAAIVALVLLAVAFLVVKALRRKP